MRYTSSLEGISSEMLAGFFVDWPNQPSPEVHLKLLKSSDRVFIAIEEHSQQIVGFITAISDNVLSAYIPLLEVLPEFQNQGIGKDLLTRMLKELDGIYMIDLVCDDNLVSYYQKSGMFKANGMLIRNYKAL
ncbi:GNAT family N-acetyltransferase [Peribacillus frigoritolerans]|uniref:GNAT family N-acetyltransferase n=1 Tax=Peribacillus frigoritolerans TaxID=450367 RepID=UPI003CFC4E20